MTPIDPHGMACRDAVELVSDYVEGALGPDEMASFEEHLALCDPCAVHLENLRRVRRATHSLAVEELDTELFQQLSGVLRMTPRST